MVIDDETTYQELCMWGSNLHCCAGGSSIHLMAPLQEMGEGELVGLTSTHHTPPWSPLRAQLLS